MRPAVALSALLCSVTVFAQADTQAQALSWLQRVGSAARALNYAGIFVFQNGKHTETSRVVHVQDDGVEREKLEVLDGSPREVVRQDDEVRCFLPDEKLVIIDRQTRRKLLPARAPEALVDLPRYYTVRLGKPDRIAGFDAEMVILEPKDSFRYGHWLWIERVSGLLLKTRMVNAKGDPMEQFVFTQLQIGGAIDPDALKPRFLHQAAQWRHTSSDSAERMADSSEWNDLGEVPGFKRQSGVRHKVGPGGREAVHFLYSDGMASVSVFIENVPKGSAQLRLGQFRNGATNVFRVERGDRLITAVGEVPIATLQTIASGIQPKVR